MLDAEETIPLGGALRPCRRANLDLTAGPSNRYISEPGVLGFPGASRDNCRETLGSRPLQDVHSAGQRADLVGLHEHRSSHAGLNTAF